MYKRGRRYAYGIYFCERDELTDSNEPVGLLDLPVRLNIDFQIIHDIILVWGIFLSEISYIL